MVASVEHSLAGQRGVIWEQCGILPSAVREQMVVGRAVCVWINQDEGDGLAATGGMVN